jgi:hypothetical protein
MISQDTEIKGQKEQVKLPLFANSMILYYIEKLKYSTKKKPLLELINDLGNISGYKFNIQKSVVLLYTNNKLSEEKIRKTIPFTNST